MSRPFRVEYAGAWYHVMNRGRGRERIFFAEPGYGAFLETIAEACDRFGVEVHAYCLMPNHYHLLLRTPLGNLSRSMRHIDGIYTQRHNRLKKTDGPLFRGRYKAILIDADDYLLSVSRYIHRNPVDGVRPLTRTLAQWPWSSYPAYINQRKPPSWLCRQTTYEALGRRSRYQGYRQFVEVDVEAEIQSYYANQRARPVLGDAGFQQRVLTKASKSAEVPRRQREAFREPQAVLAAVASEFGLAVATLTQRGGRVGDGAQARQIAMLLCRDRTGRTLRELGTLFGDIHYSAVGQNIRRVKRALNTHHRLKRKYQTIKSRLDP